MNLRLLLLSTALAASMVLPDSAAPEWTSCAENAWCATLQVPVDWAEPDGARFGMAAARHAATGEKRGTIVYLPAGPGSSGVDAVTDERILGLLLPPEVVEHFDVVSFDPRGVRRSSPVLCDSALVATLDRPEPRDQAEFDELLTAQAAVGADCRERTGPVFDHLDSTQVARDVDLLRTALGEDQLHVYALSYGTVAGQMYAEQFPERIRTMVLDGVYDHSVDSGQFAVTGALAGQESFDQFVAWCDTDAACVLHGTDVRARLAALFDRAEAGTLPISASTLTSRVVSPLTRPDLPAVAAEIANLDAPAPATAAAETTPLPIFLQCADNRNDLGSYSDIQRLAERTRAVAPDVRSSAYDTAALCINPPVPATNPQRPLRAGDAPPIMVLNSRYDASTPHQGAQHVAAQLPGSVLVTHEGMGHGAATRSECTKTLVHQYFSETELPEVDTSC
ncbi:alpha/beta fold hydrolase [Amycolatopsis sp. 195334CR]|uniref:alpha/beta fold hydrolase n=1 Tax=Amycolatopsis sp. 195334CR TaxID=2814588 RepID=UPI001A8EF5B0|nr:alpha/beta fold hydrolase [Amycolatopsis sp. 195334CR]MBN6039770.1 alpha/beta fold hydrolase [Amycolatopsis sp. 195334CR]